MNSLSWILYIAEVVGNLGTALAILGIVGTVAVVGASGFTGLMGTIDGSKDIKATSANLLLKLKWTVPMIMISCVVPSTNTVYMIAASQAGEMVIKDPEMQGIFNDLKTIIKQKIKDQLPKQS